MSLVQRENKVGMKKGSTWGTAVEPAAGNGLYVKAHTPPKGARKVFTNEDEFGRGMASGGEVLEYEAQSGSMSLRYYCEGLEAITASLMGSYSSSTPEVGVVKHKCVLDTAIGSIFHTIAWDEGDEIKAVNSAKIVSGTFSYQDGLNLDINYMGDKVAATNWTAPLNVTYPSEGKGIFKLSNATVEINAAGTSDFTGSDKFYPSGIDIAITRGIEALPITAGNESIIEPIEKAAPNVEVTLTFPKKESATAAFLNAFNNRDYKKLRITFAGSQIGSTASNYGVVFHFPKAMVMEAPDFAQDTPLPTTIKFKALKADSAPSPVMDEKVPYITIVNTVTALTGYPEV